MHTIEGRWNHYAGRSPEEEAGWRPSCQMTCHGRVCAPSSATRLTAAQGGVGPAKRRTVGDVWSTESDVLPAAVGLHGCPGGAGMANRIIVCMARHATAAAAVHQLLGHGA
eukprot:361313-Chlamydomonas_euryale.AAC.14